MIVCGVINVTKIFKAQDKHTTDLVLPGLALRCHKVSVPHMELTERQGKERNIKPEQTVDLLPATYSDNHCKERFESTPAQGYK